MALRRRSLARENAGGRFKNERHAPSMDEP
jgi:hypothetical protein